MKQENVMLASVSSAQVASSEKGRFKINIPFPGKVSQNTPPREQYPARPSHRLQPTSIAACFTSLNSPCAAYVRTKGIL